MLRKIAAGIIGINTGGILLLEIPDKICGKIPGRVFGKSIPANISEVGKILEKILTKVHDVNLGEITGGNLEEIIGLITGKKFQRIYGIYPW